VVVRCPFSTVTTCDLTVYLYLDGIGAANSPHIAIKTLTNPGALLTIHILHPFQASTIILLNRDYQTITAVEPIHFAQTTATLPKSCRIFSPAHPYKGAVESLQTKNARAIAAGAAAVKSPI